MPTTDSHRRAFATGRLHRTFLFALPRIETHARVYFRHCRCPGRKDDAIAETVALAWLWYVRLRQQGKNPDEFVSVIAVYATRAVNCGRRLCGKERAKDVLSPVAQLNRRFTISPLPDGSSLNGNVFDEALEDNTQTPVPEQVSFRVDFPTWLNKKRVRDRRLICALMTGERAHEVSRRFGVSEGRVSQLRHEFLIDWTAFSEGNAIAAASV